jgi:hypothetical protein
MKKEKANIYEFLEDECERLSSRASPVKTKTELLKEEHKPTS